MAARSSAPSRAPFRRDQRSACSCLRIQPVHASSLRQRGAALAMRCTTCTAMSPPAWLHVRSRRHHSRRDQRPVHSNTHPTRLLKCPGGHGHGVAVTSTGALRSSRPRRPALRPRAWIPEESGQVELDKSAQMRRRIRRTDDRSRRPPARPGVTPALRRWGTLPLSFRNCSPHIIRQTISVFSIGRRLDTKLHEQMKICVNSMLCLMARPQIHPPNVKTCLDVVNTYPT